MKLDKRYLLGLLIVILSVIYKPYSKEYFEKHEKYIQSTFNKDMDKVDKIQNDINCINEEITLLTENCENTNTLVIKRIILINLLNNTIDLSITKALKLEHLLNRRFRLNNLYTYGVISLGLLLIVKYNKDGV